VLNQLDLVRRENRMLRRLLRISAAPFPGIDFERDPVEVIVTKLHRATMQAVLDAGESDPLAPFDGAQR
jgi:hypothetical protein